LDRVTRNPRSPARVPPEPQYAVPTGMGREQFHAMGTTITLLLPERKVETGSRLVRGLFMEWELTLSRFLPESELSRLNRHPGVPVMVSALLYRVTAKALAAARATNGLYDPTMLDQLKQLGYDRSFDELTGTLPASAYKGRPGGGWRDIRLHHGTKCVTLPPGVQLDFGGIAKGMAVDAALDALRQAAITPALVNAGGDLSMEGLPPREEAWPIEVEGPDTGWTIPLRRGAMATSGIARRNWIQGSAGRHHLLDPRTGLPVQSDLRSVTVVAPLCEQAEVAAKVAFILGREKGRDFLREHQLAGLFVGTNGRWEAVEPWPVHLMR
jgi:thiamine biosynthesis lipoprotein